MSALDNWLRESWKHRVLFWYYYAELRVRYWWCRLTDREDVTP